MRKINDDTLEIISKKLILKKVKRNRYWWHPLNWRFIVDYHKENNSCGLRKLHLLIRLPFLYVNRNNNFTQIGEHVQVILYNTK